VADRLPGATLVGYAHGVLGMGEHVRMTAEALTGAGVPFGVVDFDLGIKNKQDDSGGDFPLIDSSVHRANIFHVNADMMLYTYCRLGPDFFSGRYNIGYWAWELANCPEAWDSVTRMMDEIWAPSKFIQDCFAAVASCPVIHMPLCVELPSFKRLTRSSFGLPEDDCLFLYAFDFNSYFQRKNPLASIRSFKKAFPVQTEQAGLVLKVMNGDTDSEVWKQMLDLIDGDPRIHVINEVMDRGQVLALLDCCDCFLSLHRSEGFGRGPAEAMYLGKPVIVTNYSGNLDFTRPGACLLVDYRLIPVQPDEYVFTEGQVWAEVDEQQAAEHMRTVARGGTEVAAMAQRGQAVIRDEFSAAAIGARMKQRLEQLNLLNA